MADINYNIHYDINYYLNNLKVLYEDNHIIAVTKFPGVLSQADVTLDPDMLTIIKEYLKRKYQKPGNVFLGLVHRLDRMAGGVMVFAKTSKGASRLSESIRENEFDKRYLAVVLGSLPVSEEWHRLVHKVSKNEAEVKSYLDENGKAAILEYRCLATSKNMSLIDVTLETGRHHQIRLQIASIGHPLYGDTLYGHSEGNLGLFSYALTIVHPITKASLTFRDKPSGSPWDAFSVSIEKISEKE
jgi:23S rRNA pseudouridine1911/1915/1917 synthase